jgi:hypothetical protein
MNNIELRDYFAGLALQGMLANYEIVKSEEKKAKLNGEQFNPSAISWMPISCYKYADEMIRIREKK